MTFTGVDFYTHECRWMVCAIQESMKILANEWLNNIGIIPLPDCFSGSGSNSLRSNITRHAKVWEMYVRQAMLFDIALKIILTNPSCYLQDS
jgi:hypothetical protein